MTSELNPRHRELIEWVERDYEVTQAVAGPSENAVIASRSIGFTLVAALLGVGVSQENFPLLALAAFSALSVYLIDAYYTWRASERDDYLRGLEDVLAARFTMVERAPRNNREEARLDRRLAALRTGSTTQIRSFRIRNIWFAQPWPLFKLLYPVLVAFAVGAMIVVGVQELDQDGEGNTSQSSCEGRVVLVAEPRADRPGVVEVRCAE